MDNSSFVSFIHARCAFLIKVLRLMLKISYAGCFGLSPAISSQFTVEMCAAAKNCEKLRKIYYKPLLFFWSGEEGSKSFKVIHVDKSKKLVTSACYDMQQVSFYLQPFAQYKPLTQGHEILSQKTRVHGAAHSKDFVILVCTILTQYSSVTDRQTDGRTDRPPGHG